MTEDQYQEADGLMRKLRALRQLRFEVVDFHNPFNKIAPTSHNPLWQCNPIDGATVENFKAECLRRVDSAIACLESELAAL